MGSGEEERLVGRSASFSPSPPLPFAPSPSRLPHLLAWALACTTLTLIGAGALVTTYRAGMAVPDWPNTFGYNLFLYPLESWLDVFDVLLEHSHRLIAAAMGLLAIALAIVLWVVDRRSAARWLGVAAVVGVSLQGTLGGLRVILDETLLADVHGCTAALFFALAAALVTYTSPAWREMGRRGEGEKRRRGEEGLVGNSGSRSPSPLLPFSPSPSRWLPPTTAIAVYLQIVLGAQLRHLTPQQGPWWFALWVWLHVIMAGLLTLAVCWLLALTSRRSGAEPMLSRRAKWLAAVLAVQLVLAAATWVTHYGWPAWLTGSIGAIPYTVVASGRLQALTTTAHVVVGFALVGGGLVVGPLVAATHVGKRRASGGAFPLPRGTSAAAKRTAVCPLPTAYCLLAPRPAADRGDGALDHDGCRAGGGERGPGLARPGPCAGRLGIGDRGGDRAERGAERWSDARMTRTALRPLPSGRITAVQAGWFGAVTSGLGLAYLVLLSDWVTVGLAAVSWAVYVAIYTPMKTRLLWQTPLGALAGAMPVFLGASAAGALSSIAALALFGVLYCWQFPHAMAIAWLYRDQFAAAGLKVASVTDPSGRTAGAIALAGAGVLLPVSLVPWWAGMAGWGYGLAALVLGLAYTSASFAFWLRRDERAARLLLRTSLAYLVALLAAMLLARG